MTYSVETLRKVALHTAKLTTPNGCEPSPTQDNLFQTIDQLGCVQLDTLQMIARSHYIILWSRHGNYARQDLDTAIYGDSETEQRCYEYWHHAACILPLRSWPYSAALMEEYRAQGGRYKSKFRDKPNADKILHEVRQKVAQGPVSTTDFQSPRTRTGDGWWDWKPHKEALELLFDEGELFVTDRPKFRRVYDLTDKAMPSWVDRSPKTREERLRYELEMGAKTLGVTPLYTIGDFTHMRKRDSKPLIDDMVKEGTLKTFEAELLDGQTHVMAVHKDNVGLLEKSADNALPTERTTFLSPFDCLWYPKGRSMLFWNFHQILEAYKPKPKQQWGYFTQPILWKDRIIGRFDPKLDRKKGILYLRKLHIDVLPTDEMLTDLAPVFRDYLAFHNATELVIDWCTDKSVPKRLLKKL